jgi:hypothetical protein
VPSLPPRTYLPAVGAHARGRGVEHLVGRAIAQLPPALCADALLANGWPLVLGEIVQPCSRLAVELEGKPAADIRCGDPGFDRASSRDRPLGKPWPLVREKEAERLDFVRVERPEVLDGEVAPAAREQLEDALS